jgi:hypothetical protein
LECFHQNLGFWRIFDCWNYFQECDAYLQNDLIGQLVFWTHLYSGWWSAWLPVVLWYSLFAESTTLKL